MKTDRFAIILVLLMILGVNSCHTRQEMDINAKNLKVGDRVPDIHIGKIIDVQGNIKSAKIIDFKDQLLILDFMHTRCSGCIAALPKMDKLQNQFKDKIKILPVTFEDENYMRTYLKRKDSYIAKNNVQLQWVVEDSVLSKWFKYKLVSHIVWIYKGMVKAITEKEYVNAENIQTILDGKIADWPVKIDVLDYDYTKPLFLTDTNQYKKDGLLMYSAITGNRIGVESKNTTFTDSIHGTIRTSLINASILAIYGIAWYNINPKMPFMNLGRVILEVSDPSRYDYKPEYGYKEVWNRKNMICYESVLPNTTNNKERYQRVVDDLNQYLGLNGRWEKRRVKCLVLKQSSTPNKKQAPSTNIPEWRMTTIENTIWSIYSQTNETKLSIPPIVDETNLKKKIEFMGEWTDIPSLHKEFLARGIDMVEAEREVYMFVLTEKK